MKKLTRLGLGIALALTLATPTALASTAAFAQEEAPASDAQIEGTAQPAETPTREVGPEPDPESDPKPKGAPDPESDAEPDPEPDAAQPGTEVQPGTEEQPVAEPAPDSVQPNEAAPSPPSAPEPRFPAGADATQLLPPNTARYVTFTITDPKGSPVLDSRVRMMRDGHSDISARTDASGRATLASVPYGEYHVQAFAPTGRTDLESTYIDGTTVFSQSQPVTINALTHSYSFALKGAENVLPGGIDGTAVDSVSDRSIAGLDVWVQASGGGKWWIVNTDISGRFSVRNLPAGAYDVWAHSTTGYKTSKRQILVGNQTTTVTWQVQSKAGSLYLPVIVKDRRGAAIVGADACLIARDGSQPGAPVRCAQSDERGIARLYLGTFATSPPRDWYYLHVAQPENTDYRDSWLGSVSPSVPVLIDFTGTGVQAMVAALDQNVTARDDLYTVKPGLSFIVPERSAGVLANDDGDGTLIVTFAQEQEVPASGSIRVATQRGGAVSIDRLGRFTYVPPKDFVGVDSFVYTVAENLATLNEAKATVRLGVGVSGVTAVKPTISGTPKVGRKLSAKTAGWGPAGVKLSYRWQRDGKNISGATGPSYTLEAADRGKKIAVRVTGRLAGFPDASSTSATTTTVGYGKLTVGKPSISGTAKVGKTLKAKTGAWKPGGVSFSYQWLRDGKKISGATKSSYKLTSADGNRKIGVRVTGKLKGYGTASKKSQTKPVAK
ncbi:MAG: carboxypeptidase regulatory-like domain-containing protein [Leucobacter sp.]